MIYPKVFISYAHNGGFYEKKVIKFAEKLRKSAVGVNIDLYEEAPSEGWPRWMENKIMTSDFVLILCCKSYYDKFYSDFPKGKGVSWEANIVYQHIYDAYSENSKFIPVIFDRGDEKYILTLLKMYTYYNVGTREDFIGLCRRLRGKREMDKVEIVECKDKKYKNTVMFNIISSLFTCRHIILLEFFQNILKRRNIEDIRENYIK